MFLPFNGTELGVRDPSLDLDQAIDSGPLVPRVQSLRVSIVQIACRFSF